MARLLLVVFALLVGQNGPLLAQGGSTETVLKVGTRIVQPFVFRDETGRLTGFSIDLWEKVARERGYRFEYVIADSIPKLLDDLGHHKTDLAISALSITSEREKLLDFSQPYFDGGLGIAVPIARAPATGAVSTFLGFVTSWAFAEVLLGIFILMFLPAPLIWLFERNSGEELLQSDSRIGQFGKAIWWSICALGGQAQDMPSTRAGRIVAVPWLMFAVLFSSYFTAAVTARITVNQLERDIDGPKDLIGKVTATVSGSTGASWLRLRGFSAIEAPNVDQALKMMLEGKADAIIYDAPVLAYAAFHDLNDRIRLVRSEIQPEHYGMAYPVGSDLRRPIDETLLVLKEGGEYRKIQQKWFGAN